MRRKTAAEVADGNILRLVEAFLTAGVMENGVYKPTTIGTPQGGVVSPLLANIVLNHLDWRLHEAGFRFARYADDFVVVCQDRRQAQEALEIYYEQFRGIALDPTPKALACPEEVEQPLAEGYGRDARATTCGPSGRGTGVPPVCRGCGWTLRSLSAGHDAGSTKPDSALR